MAVCVPVAFRLGLVGVCLMIFSLGMQKDVFVDAATSTSDVESLLLTSRGFRNTIKTAISDLQKDLAAEKVKRSSLEKKVDQLQSKLEASEQLAIKSKVAFYAKVKPSITNIHAEDTIVFGSVYTNEGGAYNKQTGEFVAPLAGTYAFYSNILAAYDGSIETCLKVNGINQMYIYSGSKFWGSGSNMAVFQLKPGDVVTMAKHGTYGSKPKYVHNIFSTFSGFLLFAH